MEKRTRSEFDYSGSSHGYDNQLSNTGFSIRYDASCRYVLATIHNESIKNKEHKIKIADFGCGHGYFTALIPAAVEDSRRLTLAFIDGDESNVKSTKKIFDYLRNNLDLYKQTTFSLMTKNLQDLDKTNYFGATANKSFDILTCMNVIHFLTRAEKQNFFNTCYRLLKPEGKLLFSFDHFSVYGKNEKSFENLLIHVGCLSPLNSNEFERKQIKSIAAMPQIDPQFYDSQSYYLMSSDLSQITKRLKSGDFCKILEELKPGEDIFYSTYIEHTTKEALISLLATVGFNITENNIKNYNFDHVQGTEFEKLVQLHPNYDHGSFFYVEATK